MLFLRITFQLDHQTPLQEEDLERFAASVSATTSTLRFLALDTVRMDNQAVREDDWYEVKYGLGGKRYAGDIVRWWYVVRGRQGSFVRPMDAAEGERIWRELIEVDEISLEMEDASEGGDV